MAVYVVATYDIMDPQGYEGYVPGVMPLLQKHGGQVLAADYRAFGMEGKTPGVNVILKFDSEAAARGWYDDPDYGPVKQIRLNSTQNDSIVMMEEFVMPTV